MKRYIRFLNLKRAVTQDQIDQELDLTSQRMLELIALSEQAGHRMTVTEAMGINVASPATIHRKLEGLIRHEYIVLEFEGNDRRTKYIALTKKSMKHFSELGKILIKSVSLAVKN